MAWTPSSQFRSISPAHDWEHALISGNGSLGALVFAHPTHETITLSHERLFMPLFRPLPAVNTASSLPELRSLLLSGQYQAAADKVIQLAKTEGYEAWHWPDPLVPAFDLRLTTRTGPEISDYARGTDFSTGVVQVSWLDDDQALWKRRLFVSRADDVAVLSLQAPAGHMLDCTLTLATTGFSGEREKQVFSDGVERVEINAEGDSLSYRSRFRRRWPGSLRGCDGLVRICAPQGSLSTSENSVMVHGTSEILVLIGLTLCYDDDDASPLSTLRQRLQALPASFDQLLGRHVTLHAPFFNRASLNLGSHENNDQSSETLLATALQNPSDAPPALFEKLFSAGRYAILSSCGQLPPTLQGIWAGSWTPAWSGDFIHNGNLPIAISSLLPASTPELMHSYFDYLESFMDDFRENARRLYNCRGIYLPTYTATHGKQNHFHQHWCHTFWTAAIAWAAHYYYDYWQYTGDRTFLAQRALPFMEEAMAFYEDFLISGDDGKLLFLPSTSPENSPANTGSQASINATMDVALVKELVRHTITASQFLEVNGEKIPAWESLLQRLPAYRINDRGELAEWLWPDLQDNHAHRHPSHLYSLFYECDPDIEHDQRLQEAARAVIEARLVWWRGEDIAQHDMAFGLVMLGLAATHLRMTETAYEIASWLATRYWRSSLVSTHNHGSIFNVDLSGGFPALLIEMLVQSHVGSIELLPVLPVQWSYGSLKGVTCRGAITLDLSWQPQHIQLTLHTNHTQHITLLFQSDIVAVNAQTEITFQCSGKQVSLTLPEHQTITLEVNVA